MSKVSVDQLAGEIVSVVQEYTEDIEAGIKAELDRTSRATLRDVRANSPVRTGEYRKGWRRKQQTTLGRLVYTIYNKTHPWLVHLLEMGHAKRNGGRVAARPHLRPAYERHVVPMERRIRAIIQRGGRR